MKMIVRKTVIIILSFLLVLFSLSRGAFGDGTTGEATLSWTMPTTNVDDTPLTDLAGVKLYYGVASGTYTTVIDATLVTTYAVTNLTVGTTYYFVATAYDTSGNESSYSNEIFKTIIAGGGTVPVPTGLQISANGGTVTVSWDKPNYSSIGGYQIQRGPTPTLFTGMYDVGVGYPDNTPCVVNYIGCSRKQCIFNGVVPGTYFWRIGAYDISSQFGAYSNAVWITISSDTIPAADVTLFTATQYGTGVRLTWTNPTNSDFSGVKISFSTIGNNGPWVLLTNLIGATPGSKEAYNHLNLPAGKTYYYKIQVIDTSGNQTNTRYASTELVPPTKTPPPVEIQDPPQTTAIVQTAPPPETKKKKEVSGFGCGTIKNDRPNGGGTDISIFAITGILLIFAMRAKLKNKLGWRTS